MANTYLYGDSTSSQLTSNFLEFLRDAIDFAVFVLQADARMKAGRVQIRVLGEESDAESSRLERFITSVSRAVHSGEKGAADSPTAQCAQRLASLIVDSHRASVDGIRHSLAEAIARIEAEESAGRDACVKALGALLAPHEPPDATAVLRLGLGDSGRYDATSTGKSAPALGWTLQIGIPDGHAWSTTMRVDRLVDHLEIRAPQLAGWISKEVKIRPQRIERMIVTELVDDGETISFHLRAEGAAAEVGFDFEVDLIDEKIVNTSRIGPADDASVGRFDIQMEDVAPILDLSKQLKATLAGLERRPNITATFDGADFRTLPTYIDFIEELVAMMTPIVVEIAVRSLTPNELVLRRALSNDRREEIFVAKVTLREKLAVLPADTRAIFDPLGLDPKKAPKPAAKSPPTPPPAPDPASDRPPIRSELPPSVPPGALPSPKAVVIAPPPALPKAMGPPFSTTTATATTTKPATPDAIVAVVKNNNNHDAPNATAPVTMFIPMKSNPPPAVATAGALASSVGVTSPVRTIQPPHGAPPPPLPPPASPPPPPTTTTTATSRQSSSEDIDLDSPSIEVLEEIEMSSDALLEAIPESSRSLVTRSEGQGRNEALVAALKKIMMLSKNGRTADAYNEYASLFSSESFSGYRADEQRQALKLMVLSKSHPSNSDEAAAAHRAALRRLEALVDVMGEPADQEMLGVALLYLGDEKAAGKAFQAGLDAERLRNPQSDLIATLMRRVSSV